MKSNEFKTWLLEDIDVDEKWVYDRRLVAIKHVKGSDEVTELNVSKVTETDEEIIIDLLESFDIIVKESEMIRQFHKIKSEIDKKVLLRITDKNNEIFLTDEFRLGTKGVITNEWTLVI